MIGRKRRRAASMAASRRLWPCSQSSLANSTMRIAFFAARPMMVIRPTLKYVVGHADRGHREHRAEGADGHDEHHRQRDRPALVERHQQQEDHQDGQGEQLHRLAAGDLSWYDRPVHS